MQPRSGFTLIEVVITLAVGVLILTGILGVFLITRQTLTRNSGRAEIVQNGRIALERLSRDLRQAEEIAGVIPEAQGEALSALEFQDGHDASALTYLRYHFENESLYLEHSYYALTSDPTVQVRYHDEET